MFPQVLDPCHLGTVNEDGERGEGGDNLEASQEATGMMSHRQGNTVLVLPLGNPLQTLCQSRSTDLVIECQDSTMTYVTN
jgi:hypothetical protein